MLELDCSFCCSSVSCTAEEQGQEIKIYAGAEAALHLKYHYGAKLGSPEGTRSSHEFTQHVHYSVQSERESYHSSGEQRNKNAEIAGAKWSEREAINSEMETNRSLRTPPQIYRLQIGTAAT